MSTIPDRLDAQAEDFGLKVEELLNRFEGSNADFNILKPGEYTADGDLDIEITNVDRRSPDQKVEYLRDIGLLGENENPDTNVTWTTRTITQQVDFSRAKKAVEELMGQEASDTKISNINDLLKAFGFPDSQESNKNVDVQNNNMINNLMEFARENKVLLAGAGIIIFLVME